MKCEVLTNVATALTRRETVSLAQFTFSGPHQSACRHKLRVAHNPGLNVAKCDGGETVVVNFRDWKVKVRIMFTQNRTRGPG
jgi:hypothetical protein